MPGSISANAIVSVEIDGESFGRWDVKTGGQTTADITKHRPGGSLHEEFLNGLPTADDITLDRVYDRARDHVLLNRLTGKVGTGEVMVVWQPTDGNMVPTADAPVRRAGRLAAAPSLGPDYDSTSADAARIEITVALAG